MMISTKYNTRQKNPAIVADTAIIAGFFYLAKSQDNRKNLTMCLHTANRYTENVNKSDTT